MSNKKELAKLIANAQSWAGWRVKEVSDGWMLFPPDKQMPAITIHKTPSDWRAWKNMLSRLRRAGAPV